MGGNTNTTSCVFKTIFGNRYKCVKLRGILRKPEAPEPFGAVARPISMKVETSLATQFCWHLSTGHPPPFWACSKNIWPMKPDIALGAILSPIPKTKLSASKRPRRARSTFARFLNQNRVSPMKERGRMGIRHGQRASVGEQLICASEESIDRPIEAWAKGPQERPPVGRRNNSSIAVDSTAAYQKPRSGCGGAIRSRALRPTRRFRRKRAGRVVGPCRARWWYSWPR